jgi:SAM-dependent methyltransferase
MKDAQMDQTQNPRYEPSIFIQPTLDDAKQIILMPEQGLTTEQRWELETEWLRPKLQFDEGLVIDYGCGVGRLSKVIEPNYVLGIDISPTMRAQAPDYVQKAGFAVTHPFFLREMVKAGLRANGAVAAWCLQHCLDLKYDLELLYDTLLPGARFYCLDAPRRYIPASINDGKEFIWANDGVSIDQVLHEVGFAFHSKEDMPEKLCQPGSVFRTWIR